MIGISMIKNKVIRPYPFDVDDCLVIWDAPDEEKTVSVRCPFVLNRYYKLKPNIPMIELLKTKAVRGHFVIVWSQSGMLWAEAVVTALNLEGYVNQVSDKFNEYADDLPIEDWAQTRVFLSPESKWRNNGD